MACNLFGVKLLPEPMLIYYQLPEPSEINFRDIWIKIWNFSFKKTYDIWKCSGQCLGLSVLTHWGRVAHLSVSKLTIISWDNGLSPGQHQAIIWTNAGILLIQTLGTNISEIFIAIHKSLFKKMHFKMSSGKCQPFCLGLNVLWPRQSMNQSL